MNLHQFCCVFLLCLGLPAAWGDPLIAGAKTLAVVPAPLLSASDPASARFLSVGQMKRTVGLGWSCTATLVAGVASPPPDAPALILTAGHCGKGLTGDNEVTVDQPMGEGWLFTPSYFFDNQNEHQSFTIEKIRYSSMKSTDIAVLQLKMTYGEMLDRGFKPVQLKTLDPGQPSIEVAHAPVWLFPDRFLRYSVCETSPATAVFETDQYQRPDLPWFWPAFIPNNCVGIYPGSSGSPVFVKNSSEISGVMSTGLDQEESGCGYGKPCEIKDGRQESHPGIFYFASTDMLKGAFKTDGTFDSSMLDPGTGVALERIGDWISPAQTVGAAYKSLPAYWSMRINDAHDLIRYKTGFADQVNCADSEGYGPQERTDSQPLLELPVGPAKGIYAICAIGGRTSDGQWQPYSQATIKLRQIE